jgi:hypothetical protein
MNQTNDLSLAVSNSVQAVSFCSVWPMASGILTGLLPNVPNATLKTAMQALIAAGNAVCAPTSAKDLSNGTSCPCDSNSGKPDAALRRHMAENILNKAALDPQWRAKLLNNPQVALADAGFDVNTLPPFSPEVGCDFSCIIST